MSQVCENIVNENENLKLVRTLEQFYVEVLEYLKTKFNVDDIEITLLDTSEEDREDILYKSSNKLIEHENCVFELIQSEYTKIRVIVSSNDDKNIIENRFVINLALQAFSQTLYNKLLKDTLKDLSLIDSLTGLYNRHYLENYAEKLLSLSIREKNTLGFLKFGIDQFKAVIDEFDYNIGDKVLIALSDVLKETLRTSDIILRIDSDEFLVILMNIQDNENASMIAQKIIEAFAQKEVLVNEQTKQTLKKTVCCGIAIFPDDASSMDEIFRKSDIALYEAKNKGRSQFFTYTQEDTNTIDLF
ncbi:GGDEF domain-containing protein [Arcobacter roscoffensis]|uniref:diguanylate cyclase n=1 Tax=Arcobacter roscoffensis TaxID=2961520 RepID=A0ABY5DZP8_9BACT|nr:GGDEF domain-containing protein [Arcobacter roscoffensis]UTJ05077.1 GGDEF domain-containing protein [Arcobacter roscoffensis]